MTTVSAESITPLEEHPALLQVAPDLPTLTQRLYGRDWPALAVGSDTFTLSFREVHIQHAELQLRLRCGGQDYELQVAHPSTFADFQGALSHAVPARVQRAAVLHALAPLWQALEQRFQMSIELVDLQVCVPAWPAAQALGLLVTREGTASQRTALLLRADSAQAWQQLGRTSLIPSPDSLAMDALKLRVYAHAAPIGLTLNEFSQLEPGDVLVTDVAAGQRDQLAVRLVLHGRALDGVSASLRRTQLVIDRVPTQADAHLSEWAASPSLRQMTNPTMKNETTTTPVSNSQPAPNLDSVKVDIELELASMTVPLSTLRTLSVGQVFDTLRPINSQSVVLWCGGQRLGVGQLVAVGDRVGVRVAALEPSAAASVAASPSVSVSA